MTIIDKFTNPELIDSLSFGNTVLAAVYLTVVGMVIIFLVLVILWFLTVLLSRACRSREERTIESGEKLTMTKPIRLIEPDRELAAVISAVIAEEMNIEPSAFRVKRIAPVREVLSSWTRLGIIDNLNNRI